MSDNLKNLKGWLKGHYRSIRCYYNPKTNEIIGKNRFSDFLLDINIWWDFKVLKLQTLPIWFDVRTDPNDTDTPTEEELNRILNVDDNGIADN